MASCIKPHNHLEKDRSFNQDKTAKSLQTQSVSECLSSSRLSSSANPDCQSRNEKDNCQSQMERIVLPVFNIERFALHDGPGIRTVLFVKGCPLHCPWCANPESQSVKPLLRYQKEKCTGCKACQMVCPRQAVSFDAKSQHCQIDRRLCSGCGKCTEVCLNQARSIAGQDLSLAEISCEILKDEAYYQATGGGLTVSGGEATLYAQSLLPLLKTLKAKKISIAIETCGASSLENFKLLLPYIDQWLFDLKSLDEQAFEEATGGNLGQILENLEFLAHQNPKAVTIRMPLLPGWNTDRELIAKTAQLMKSLNLHQIDLLPYHTLGVRKYEELGRPYLFDSLEAMPWPQAEPFQAFFQSQKIDCRIGG